MTLTHLLSSALAIAAVAFFVFCSEDAFVERTSAIIQEKHVSTNTSSPSAKRVQPHLDATKPPTKPQSKLRSTPLNSIQEGAAIEGGILGHHADKGGRSQGGGVNKHGKQSNAVNLQLYPPPPDEETMDKTFIPAEFHVARLSPSPKLGKPMISYKKSHGDSPRYECAGTAYDEYMAKAAEMVHRRVQLAPKDSLWGKRPSVLPDKRPQAVLMMGNSHVRQIVQTLEWQHHEQIEHFERDTVMRFKNHKHHIDFIINHGSVYSAIWQQNIEQKLGNPIALYDVIVLGTFNAYDPIYKDGNMWSRIRHYAKTKKQQHVDLDKYPNGFGLQALLDAYEGPVISLSSFAIRYADLNEQNLQIALNATARGRDNIRVINSRLPIEAIGGGECAYESGTDNVMECNPVLASNHRCMGDKGGIPDFAAWDLVEAFHDLLE